MISDLLVNCDYYPYGAVWRRAMAFLREAGPDMPDGRYELLGDALYVMVQSYEAKPEWDCMCESHRKYADIQTVLDGKEYLDWFPASRLTPASQYDPDKDVVFHVRPRVAPVRMLLEPELFVLLFPGDAHRPQVKVDDATRSVRKAVAKIRLDMLA